LHRLEIIREFVRRGNYRITLHAENERDADHIFKYEIEEAFLSEKAEIIEELIIITMYRPQADKWIEWKYRKRSKTN